MKRWLRAALLPLALLAAGNAFADALQTAVEQSAPVASLSDKQKAAVAEFVSDISSTLGLTDAQQAVLVCLSEHDAAQCPPVKLTAQQDSQLQQLAPGLKLTPQLVDKLRDIALDTGLNMDQRIAALHEIPGLHTLIDKLRAIVYDDHLTVDARIVAMEKLTGFKPQHPFPLNVCIWDISGRLGPIFAAAEEQRTRILSYGIDAEMTPYTSESVMVQALKAGKCDAALMTGLRARSFNKYTGTADSIGGLESLDQMKLLQRVLASPQLADKIVSGHYVVMGIAPAGGAYIFVDDKRINSLAKAAGKKVAVLAYDKVQAQMVAQVGATPVPTSLVEAPNMFNNHVVDVLPAPLVAYQALELYKGMSPDGGIIKLPIAELTMQLIGNRDKIPNLAAQLVREAFFENFDRITARLKQEFAKVPDHWWVPIPAADKSHYEVMMQQARVQLRDKGYYDGDMLKLERKVRCHFDPTRPECTNPVE